MRADPTSSTRWKHMWGITKEASCGIRRYPRWVGEERGGDGMGGMREESGTRKGKEGFFFFCKHTFGDCEAAGGTLEEEDQERGERRRNEEN